MNQLSTDTNNDHQEDNQDEISCLLLPLKEKQLLLPNVSVAEIVPFSHLLTTASSAKWVLGQVEWRGVSVPVACYELINNQPAPAPNTEARFAIVNGISGNAKLPFYAILIQGIPRLVRVNKEDLKPVEAMHIAEYDACAVNIEQSGSAMIPDLDKLEVAFMGTF